MATVISELKRKLQQTFIETKRVSWLQGHDLQMYKTHQPDTLIVRYISKTELAAVAASRAQRCY